MRTETTPTIHRTDYRPLAWTVEKVDLHFALDPAATTVTNRMVCVRNPDADPGPLVLYAEDLERIGLAVDGESAEVAETEQGVEVPLTGERAVLEVVTRIAPEKNTTLSGLYLSRGGFFTQCEAEGFRRITYFPDRPDVMARYTVTLEADRAACPVLLANGNLMEQGELEGGRHWARWEDPFPKPSYLFALVAGDLHCHPGTFTTRSGKNVRLEIWVEHQNKDKCEHALRSL